MIVETRKTGELKTYKRNPKSHPVEQIDKIAKSIEEFGFNVPLVIDENNVVITGHGRLLAAQKTGLKEVPVLVKNDLSIAQIKAFRIADNRVGESDWINGVLKDELNELLSVDYDLKTLGFNDDELSRLVGIEVSKELVDDTVEVEGYIRRKQAKYEVKTGDVWVLGVHRLMCGDSIKNEDVDVLMKGEKADMVFTDPPYSVNFTKKAKEIFGRKDYVEIKNDNMTVEKTAETLWKPSFNNMYEYSKDECSFYITMPQGGDQMMMMMMMNNKWQVKHELIWVKENTVFSMNRLDYDYKHEPIMYGWKKKHNFYGKGKYTNSIWEIKRMNEKLHPTMKPIELIENCLLNSSIQEDNVLDLFGGSGSTMVVAEQLGRKCYMMEIDPFYCSVIIERWENLTKKKARKVIKK